MNSLQPPSIDEQILDIREQLLAIQSSLIDLRDNSQRDQRTKIVDFNMPFLALVGILIKITLASIPAMIIVAVLFGGVAFIGGALLAGVVAVAPLLDPPVPIASTPRSSITRPTATIAPSVAVSSAADIVLTAIDSQDIDGNLIVTGVLANRGSDPTPAMSVVVAFQIDGRSPVEQRAVIQPISPGQTVPFTVTNTLPGDWTYIVQIEDYLGHIIPFRDVAP